MKAKDIVNRLAVKLPLVTDKFTDNFTVVSLTRSGTTVTAVTSIAHGLSVGMQVNIVGAQTPIVITSLTRVGVVGTLVTSTPHDMTENFSTTVEISGATEAEFNGVFTILKAPDRNTITFTMVDSGPTIATGSPLLLNGSSELQSYNGLHNVTAVPTTTSFEYEITNTSLFSPASGTINARISPRITHAVDSDRMLASYTKYAAGKLWAFVVLEDTTASKSRNQDSDATDNLQKGSYFRQQITGSFTLYVIFPTSNEIAAADARDDAHELFKHICQSVLHAKFDSFLTVGVKNPVMFNSHGAFAYNTAFYIHAYVFEAVEELTFGDTVGYDTDVAFRDIQLNTNLDIGTEPLTAAINLDDNVP